jgi:putative protease
VESLDEARLAGWTRRVVPRDPTPPALPAATGDRPAPGVVPELVVAVADEESARACLDAGADRVLVSAGEFALGDPRVNARIPRVVHEHEMSAVLDAARAFSPPQVAGNLGALSEAAAGGSVEADWGLNATNPWTVSVLAELGASEVWASPELTGRQIASLVASSSVPIGVLAGGRIELMVAEHCVLQSAGACSHACASCPRRRQAWTLCDRKGYLMPVATDSAGRAHIYNGVPLDLSRAIAELLDAGVASVRLEMWTEHATEAARVTSEWRARFRRAASGKQLPLTAIVEPSTSGHFHRGVT